MVEEAARRGLARVVVADAHALPFEAATFDGAWADRVFQHLADPVAALAEMARVVKPGGRIVVADPDYATQVVSVPDQTLADRVLRVRERAIRNGTLAHRMAQLFAEAGLADIHVEAVPVVLRDPQRLDHALGLRTWATGDDAAAWQRALDEAAAGGWFLYAFSIFVTAGERT
jgi:SAM-dependent methyltransferase